MSGTNPNTTVGWDFWTSAAVSDTLFIPLLDPQGFWLRSSTTSFGEERFGSPTLMDDHKQPTGVEVYKAAATGSGHKSASEPRACGKCVSLVIFPFWAARTWLHSPHSCRRAVFQHSSTFLGSERSGFIKRLYCITMIHTLTPSKHICRAGMWSKK